MPRARSLRTCQNSCANSSLRDLKRSVAQIGGICVSRAPRGSGSMTGSLDFASSSKKIPLRLFFASLTSWDTTDSCTLDVDNVDPTPRVWTSSPVNLSTDSCKALTSFLSCLKFLSIRLNSTDRSEVTAWMTPSQNSSMLSCPELSISSMRNISSGLSSVKNFFKSIWSSSVASMISAKVMVPLPSSSRRENIPRSSSIVFFRRLFSWILCISLLLEACSSALLTITAVMRFISTIEITSTKPPK
mmetsp:Transcript_72923/g.171052  ORF Transcript_72923/g.171052 Transcript_72923/m.171052 type:complete len:245 (-) Transcript_72923:303-1037(-)